MKMTDKMKTGALAAVLAASLGLGFAARAADEPFADQVETRHGLMLAMANELSKLGAVMKGEAPYDQATATTAAEHVAALASVITLDYFPAGSEAGAATDSFAKPELWANQADFLAKIADLNKAAGEMVVAAGTSGEAITAAMPALGGACSACHTPYRQPEN